MNFLKFRRLLLLPVLACSGIFSSAFGARVQLQPVADTTLIEVAPDNNMGGTEFVNAGTAGANGARNRALYKFDFSSIPRGSSIKSAVVTLEVSREPGMGAQSSSFALHRFLRSWGEGDKDSLASGTFGLGLPATEGEATWNSPFAFTTNTWTFPGASNDFATVSSSSTIVLGVGDFPRFDSTSQMTADVQWWLDHPEANFGWLLKAEDEATARTARGFGSREFVVTDPNSAPYVEIEFIPAPTISNVQLANSELQFSFLAESNQVYVVEFQNALATNSWFTLTNIAESVDSTNVLISDSLSTNQRFYRVVAP
jgi:hypothetical protein